MSVVPRSLLLRVFLLYSILTVVMALPFSLHTAGSVVSLSSDTELFMWTLAWDTHALLHHPLAVFDANIFYPFRHTLAYSENLIGSVIFAAPVLWLTDNPVLAMNVVALISIPLSGLGAFLLARRLGASPPAAVLCGLVWAFTPPRFLRLEQIHLTTIQWIPFTLAFLHSYAETGRARDLRWAAWLFALQVLATGHGAAMLVLAGGLFAAFELARGLRLAPMRRLRDLGLVGALPLALVALLYVPYRAVQDEVGLRRGLDMWQAFSASSFVSSPSHLQTFILSQLPDWAWLRQRPNAWLFPGFLPILLAAAAFWPRLRRPVAASLSTAGDGPVVGFTDGAREGGRRAWRAAATILEVSALALLVLSLAVAIGGRVRLRVGDVQVLRASGWRPALLLVLVVALRLGVASRVPIALRERARRLVARLHRPRGITRPASVRSHAVFYLLVLLTCAWLTVGPPFGLWGWVYWLPGFSFIRVPSRFLLLGYLALAVLAAFGFDRLTSGRTVSRRAAAAGVGALLLCEFAVVPLGVRPYTLTIPPIRAVAGAAAGAVRDRRAARSRFAERRHPGPLEHALHALLDRALRPDRRGVQRHQAAGVHGRAPGADAVPRRGEPRPADAPRRDARRPAHRLDPAVRARGGRGAVRTVRPLGPPRARGGRRPRLLAPLAPHARVTVGRPEGRPPRGPAAAVGRPFRTAGV